ncbi:recombination protein NinG [Marinobacter salarius]|uniref:recombination protein NinG n=1 Tax=Marinobacter salarius TaxID=1420917 RepID=UPI0010AADCF5|nr:MULTISPECIES: recombination protein NinG [Marinobacter]HIO30746.1 ninG protein [Marinobacter salarius]HIP01755.1 ninG protein [Marinobacter salarius]
MKKCRICKAKFEPYSSLQVACSPKCALSIAQKGLQKAAERKAKETRQWVREGRKKLKSRGDWLKDAQTEFNKFVRLRDRHQPCISCGNYPDDAGLITGSRIDAGHYRSVGACPELRFEELNCHAQCVKCNQHLSGNTVEYRIRLIQRLGHETVEWIEGPHEPKHYTIDDLQAIAKHYRKAAREFERERKAA